VDISDTCRSSQIPFTLPHDTGSDGESDDNGVEEDSSSCGSSNAAPLPPLPPPQKKARIELSKDIQEQHHSEGSISSSTTKKQSTKMTFTKQKSDGKTIVNNFYF
jgi:hypothetical protein